MEKILSSDGLKTLGFIHEHKTVLDDSVCSALTLAEKAALFSKVTSNVTVLTNFKQYFDGRAILAKIQKQEDVTVELLFNGLELTDTQKRLIAEYTTMMEPIVKALGGIKPDYPFSLKETTKLKVNRDKVSNGSYTTTLLFAKKHWLRASKYWVKVHGSEPKTRSPNDIYDSVPIEGSGRYINVKKESISVGCQTITRWQLEQLALEQGWEFP